MAGKQALGQVPEGHPRGPKMFGWVGRLDPLSLYAPGVGVLKRSLAWTHPVLHFFDSQMRARYCPQGAITVIHTGNWGSGAFGNNHVLMALLRLGGCYIQPKYVPLQNKGFFGGLWSFKSRSHKNHQLKVYEGCSYPLPPNLATGMTINEGTKPNIFIIFLCSLDFLLLSGGFLRDTRFFILKKRPLNNVSGMLLIPSLAKKNCEIRCQRCLKLGIKNSLNQDFRP